MHRCRLLTAIWVARVIANALDDCVDAVTCGADVDSVMLLQTQLAVTQASGGEHKLANHVHDKSGCRWLPRQYVPSLLEQEWHAAAPEIQKDPKAETREWPVGCAKFKASRPAIAAMTKALKSTQDASTSFMSESLAVASNLSYHIMENSCTSEQRVFPIEPLVAALRQPDYPCEAAWSDTDYMLLPHAGDTDAALGDGKTTRNLWFFDAGASLYKAPEDDSFRGGNWFWGVSEKWFVDAYRKRGIEFNEIIGWEAEKFDPQKIWDAYPEDIKYKVRYFNIYASGEKDHTDNPLRVIKQLTRPEDFVMFKLDIDHSVTEESIVTQLLNDKEAQGLIDEFYFEHHVLHSPMVSGGWGQNLTQSGGPAKLSTFVQSYDLFTQLREAGIRAHSWV